MRHLKNFHTITKPIIKLELTDKGESAPRPLSRKKEAESIVAIASIVGLAISEDDSMMGGRDDQTLPFISTNRNIRLTRKNIRGNTMKEDNNKHEVKIKKPKA